MKKPAKEKIVETDLYKPIYDYLVKQGYTVHSEVKNCDITAIKGNELVIVELKCNMNLTLILQATQRQRSADSVYVAVPRPKGSIYSKSWKHIFHLLRRLELGLIFVSLGRKEASVEIVLHPERFDVNKSKQQGKRIRKDIIKEIEGRYADFNEGGSTRKKLMTAYRENSIHIACCLERFGPMSPSKLKKLGTGEKTPSILTKNFYGWFVKVSRGVYAISDEGKKCLESFPELVQHYQSQLDVDNQM